MDIFVVVVKIFVVVVKIFVVGIVVFTNSIVVVVVPLKTHSPKLVKLAPRLWTICRCADWGMIQLGNVSIRGSQGKLPVRRLNVLSKFFQDFRRIFLI